MREFPRPHRRGPVEAPQILPHTLPVRDDFRALTGAAPLKHEGLQAVQEGVFLISAPSQARPR